MDWLTLLGIVFVVLGAVVTLLEIHSLTIYLLAVAVGLFAGGGVALVGGSLEASLLVLAAVIILGMPFAHWWRGKLKNREAEEVSHDDAGRHVTVVGVEGTGLRVDYRGTTWSARLGDAATATPAIGSTYVIARREGNLLILAP